jgi:hypothetical protein
VLWIVETARFSLVVAEMFVHRVIPGFPGWTDALPEDRRASG